jgi:hypothetical protein
MVIHDFEYETKIRYLTLVCNGQSSKDSVYLKEVLKWTIKSLGGLGQ